MTYCKRFLLFTRTSYIHKYACCTVVSNTCIYTYIAYNFYCCNLVVRIYLNHTKNRRVAKHDMRFTCLLLLYF